MQQKLILISMDALIYEDLAYLRNLPTFSWFVDHSAIVEQVKSIYPTLTYPCHATMATGRWPSSHGVVNNTVLEPGNPNSPWLWYHDAYRCKDLPDACKEAGLSVASVSWPTTGNHPSVDYLLDEIAATNANTEETYRIDYEKTGTSHQVWNDTVAEHIHLRLQNPKHPGLCYFVTNVCCDMIRKYKPHFTMLHVANVDSYRHKTGVFSELVERGLRESDEVLRRILQAVEESGDKDCTNIVITADHGQMNISRIVNPNVMLKENGFITVEKGKVTNWKAWTMSAGMCAPVYVNDKGDEASVYEFLLEKAKEGIWGFEKVYTREEAAAEGYAGEFSFVLETDNTAEFCNAYQGPYEITLESTQGAHGYHPDKGPKHPILAYGPAFEKGVTIPCANLVDGAPTWAKVLGVDLPDCDGRVLHELLI